ncbi:MAG: hypothetical protein ACXAB4_05095 [Candidatus Hodarchaeales archaeon]|jgi:hypothetical protein
MRIAKRIVSPIKHRDLLLYAISKTGPAPPNAIYEKTQRVISSLGNRVYPLNFTQFRSQLHSLIRKGLVVRNGFALQVTKKGYRRTLP